MTKNSNFKRLVRERMAATGERYATARGHVLAAKGGGSAGAAGAKADGTGPNGALGGAGLFETVTAVGGQQPDLAAARNLCTYAGVRGPDGEPLSEALAFGLAGGIGFLYGVFEYADGPTMTIVARNKSMPDPFCEPLFAAAGATAEISTTGSAKKAATQLDAAIEERRPTLCTVGAGALPYLGACEGLAPHLVGVVGSDGEEILLDDRSPMPIRLARADFDNARGAYGKAKNRMITITGVVEQDWDVAIRAAVAASVAGFETPPVPQFAGNIGLAGLRKFHQLLHPKGAKSWHRIFTDGRRAAIGLSRLHDCIDYAYTAPSAGRPLYGEFLRLAGHDEAAERFETSGRHWAEIVDVATAAHPSLAAYAELGAERAAQLDAGDGPDLAVMERTATEQTALVDGCDISAAAAAEAYLAIAGHVEQIIDHEEAGLAQLAAEA